jgi:hypothetical protein
LWLRRCYRNARALTGATQHATAWAIWGWIVPVVSLVMPLLVVRDAFARSRRFHEAAAPVPAAVGWWWGLVIGSVVAGALADSTWRSSARWSTSSTSRQPEPASACCGSPPAWSGSGAEPSSRAVSPAC